MNRGIFSSTYGLNVLNDIGNKSLDHIKYIHISNRQYDTL